jgi:hypothetical protein
MNKRSQDSLLQFLNKWQSTYIWQHDRKFIDELTDLLKSVYEDGWYDCNNGWITYEQAKDDNFPY